MKLAEGSKYGSRMEVTTRLKRRKFAFIGSGKAEEFIKINYRYSAHEFFTLDLMLSFPYHPNFFMPETWSHYGFTNMSHMRICYVGYNFGYF
jgi:hypothetical protein